jgi:hypothetical protein
MSAPNSVAEVLASIDAARTFPAYDPEHPSEEIIGAWEKVRSWRDWLYQQDDINGCATDDWSKEHTDRLDDEHIALEGFVRGNWATTPAGAAAQLSLIVIDVDQGASLERCIVQAGLRAAYLQRDGLGDGSTQQLIQVAYELQCMEWDQALAAYERSKPICKLAHDTFNAFDTLQRRRPALADDLAALRDLVTATERAASNHKLVERLMKTLVAERDELPRKIQILIDENMLDEAGPWLLRDVAYLNASTKEA